MSGLCCRFDTVEPTGLAPVWRERFTSCGLEEFLRSELDTGRQTDGYRPSAGDVSNKRTNQKYDGDLCAVPILPLEVEKGCNR